MKKPAKTKAKAKSKAKTNSSSIVNKLYDAIVQTALKLETLLKKYEQVKGKNAPLKTKSKKKTTGSKKVAKKTKSKSKK